MSQNPTIYDKALEFAISKYAGRLRKDGSTPVLLHGLRVVEILRRVAKVSDDNILAVAVLHDVLEDTEATKEELERIFAPVIAELINSLTEDRSLPKPERKAKMLEGFSSLPHEAKLVKLADRLDNLRGSWIPKSGIQSRYIRECREMVGKAVGVCAELESELLEQLTYLEQNE